MPTLNPSAPTVTPPTDTCAPRQVSFKFGTTEIQIIAVDVKTGKQVDTNVQFLAG